MSDKYNNSELTSAIKTCIDYMFPKQRVLMRDKNVNILEVMNNLRNSDNSKFVHYYPYSLIFKITSGCNLRCKHCFFEGNSNLYNTSNDLNEDILFDYLKFFVEEINIINCTLTGGEIFTTSYLMKFLRYLKSKNIIVELLTNGTNITQQDAKALSELLNPKTDSIQISLEGPENINDFIRGAGVFAKAKKSIKLLTNYNIRVCISMTINSYNSDKIDEMYELCRELKISQLNIGKMVICNNSQKNWIPDNDDIITSLAKVINKSKINNDLRIKIRALKVFDFLMYKSGKAYIDEILKTNPLMLNEENLHCRANSSQVTLFPTGDISLCYNCESNDLCIGNLTKQSFNDIWQNRFNKTMFKTRDLSSTCKKCKYVALCKGGCPLNAYNAYKTTNAPDGNCQYAQKMIGEKIWIPEDTKC